MRVKAIWLGHASAVETGNLADFSTSTYAQIELHVMIWAYNVPAIRAFYIAWRQHTRQVASEYYKDAGSVSRGIVETSKTAPVEQTDGFGRNGHFPMNTLDA